MPAKTTLRICEKGHKYYKSSNCNTCPICEAGNKPQDELFSLLYAPARRALQNNSINTLEQLSTYTEKDILQLHGMGKSAIPLLKSALEKKGLSFKKSIH